MSTDPLLFERRGHIALLTLNRPATRNALDGEDLFAAIESTFARMNEDLSIRAAVLTGAGTAFCSGGNVAEMRDHRGMFAGAPAQITANYKAGIQRIPRAFAQLHVPIIAAVNGPAIGAGNDLACMCDIRVASSSARFAESFVKVGIVPGDGGCWLLPRVVGASQAAELAFTGDAIGAEEALRIGLVSRVVPPGSLLSEALALAARIAANPPQVLRWTKQLLQQARTGTLEVSVVVLAGSERAFCAGADLNEYLHATPIEIIERQMDRLWGAIARCRKPVIAAVRGHALGGGCELAMHADLIIAGKGARFGQPEVLIGLMPGGGATQRLTRAVGKFRAMRLLLTGEPIGAPEALAMGLASEVVADAQVEARALVLGRQLAGGAQQALRLVKAAVLQGMNMPLDAALEYERRSFQVLFSGQDKHEGIASRLQKRPAAFSGK